MSDIIIQKNIFSKILREIKIRTDLKSEYISNVLDENPILPSETNETFGSWLKKNNFLKNGFSKNSTQYFKRLEISEENQNLLKQYIDIFLPDLPKNANNHQERIQHLEEQIKLREKVEILLKNKYKDIFKSYLKLGIKFLKINSYNWVLISSDLDESQILGQPINLTGNNYETLLKTPVSGESFKDWIKSVTQDEIVFTDRVKNGFSVKIYSDLEIKSKYDIQNLQDYLDKYFGKGIIKISYRENLRFIMPYKPAEVKAI